MSWRLKRTKHLIVLAVSLAVASATTARADILHVPGDFPTIQFVQEERRCEAGK